MATDDLAIERAEQNASLREETTRAWAIVDLQAAEVEQAYTLIVSSLPALYRSWRDSASHLASDLNRKLLDIAIGWAQDHQRAMGRDPDDYSEYAALAAPAEGAS